MSFPVWRGREPTRALNSKKKCPHQTERGWLVGARGTEWSIETPLIGYFTIEVSSVNWKVILARNARKAGKARKAILAPASISFLAFLACLAFLASSYILLSHFNCLLPL